MQFLLFAAIGVGVVVFAGQWVARHRSSRHVSAVDLPLALCPLGFAIVVTQLPGHQAGEVARTRPRYGPARAHDVAVVATACARPGAGRAILDDSKSVTGPQSRPDHPPGRGGRAPDPGEPDPSDAGAHRRCRRRSTRRRCALRETDNALEHAPARRTRPCASPRSACARSSRRRSTASSSSTTRDVIVRANEAFCQMVGLASDADRGPAVDRARGRGRAAPTTAFASLPVDRAGAAPAPEGQPLYLESRISEIPGTRRGGCCWSATSRPAAWPTRRSGRCSSSCRTATRTGRGCCAGRTRRSRASATASRATSTTGRCKGCRPRRSRSRPCC